MHWPGPGQASGNSASGRPRHLGAIVLTIHQTSMKYLFYYPTNITVLTNRYEISIHLNICSFLFNSGLQERVKHFIHEH